MMIDDYEKSLELYYAGREAYDKGEYQNAITLLYESIDHHLHFKSLELIGDCYFRLCEYKKAIIPLAAATSLNKGSRAPTLLAEVFYNLSELDHAKDMAEEALSRIPSYGPAKSIHEKIKTKIAEGS